MLDEYVLVPDIFDPKAYSDPAFIEMCLPHLREPLLQEALVRDLCDGGWSQYCRDNSGTLHRLCRELLRKLSTSNRLRRFPRKAASTPACACDWCQEGLYASSSEPLTGIIAAHATKQSFAPVEVASIEKLTATPWWRSRSPSLYVYRTTDAYLKALRLVLLQANSIMFIDPNLDPSSYNYREFQELLFPLHNRLPRPQVEIHRSFCLGDGPNRTFPTVAEWKARFQPLNDALSNHALKAEVFLWQDFHYRFLVTDLVGFMVPEGFDITGRPGEKSRWGRLGRDDKEDVQREFDPATRPGSLKGRFSIGT